MKSTIQYPNGTILKIYQIKGTELFTAKIEDKDGFTWKIIDLNMPFSADAVEAVKVLASHFDSIYLGWRGDARHSFDYST